MDSKKLRIIEYRGFPLLDREKEEKFLLGKFSEKPTNILFVYGPKSSGKTTLHEYILEEKLQKETHLAHVVVSTSSSIFTDNSNIMRKGAEVDLGETI